MFSTPLYDELTRRADRGKTRFHMPGHKGKSAHFPAAARIDFTELEGTDNLYMAQGVIAKSQRQTAKAYGASGCMYLTCGATAGIFTALSFFAGEQVLVDRNCHKSVIHACAALDITPKYLAGQILPGYNISKPIEITRADLCGCRAAIITSPTYYGLNWDIHEAANTCKQAGAKLIVDAAHGAHLPFLGRKSPIEQGADLCVMSPHKTLCALGQAGLLLSGGAFSQQELENAAQVFATSSPSYVIMASIELAVFQALTEKDRLLENAAIVEQIRQKINRLEKITALTGADLDPLRLCVNFGSAGVNAREIAKALEREHDIVCEMADNLNIVFIITAADTRSELEKLYLAIEKIEKFLKCDIIECVDRAALPQTAQTAATPRAALFGKKSRVSLEHSLGRVSAQVITVYPPGTVICAPGQVIDEQILAYLFSNGQKPTDEMWVSNFYAPEKPARKGIKP